MDEPLHVFVLGLDDHNRAVLDEIADRDRYAFHGVLSIDELQRGDDIPVEDLLADAEEAIRDAGVPPAAIVGWWDFPVSLMIPVLAQRFDLPSCGLEPVLRCEHKWWSRRVQSEVVDCHPDFALVDPEDRAGAPPLDYPFWLKPVKSFSSALAYRVDDDESFRTAKAEIAEGIGRVGEPFEHFLDLADIPDEVRHVGGTTCIAESVMSGRQCTVEGWARDGEVHIHGVVDSVCYPDSPSFLRFELPSTLPTTVQERLTEATRAVIDRIGLDGCTFNVEFFVDPETDRIGLLEVNPRHSQSHAPLLQAVHGVVNHRVQIELALDEEPDVPRDAGPHDVAAKWFYRCVGDGVVTRSPGEQEVTAIEARFPDTTINVVAHQGDRLSELPGQDAYSSTLAEIYTAAPDQDALRRQFDVCVDALGFEVDGRQPQPAAAPA